MSLWTTLYDYLPTCLCLQSLTNCIWPQEDTVYSKVHSKEIISHEPPVVKVSPSYSYRRINHFNEFLTKLNTTSFEVPSRLVNQIIAYYQQIEKTELSKITRQEIKLCLRETKNQQYYEHINAIQRKITGQKFHLMPKIVEDKLRQRFQAIEEPFQKHCPPSRTSFLSYSYVIRKLLELMNQDIYLQFFPQLKSKAKLIASDQIWKAICEELGWQFHPSITPNVTADITPINISDDVELDNVIEDQSNEIVII
jgi:hypothetical protein